MALTAFTATAATCEVAPGIEQANDEGLLKIRGQVFTDLVESQDLRIAGTNLPNLDIDLNPQTGDGELTGGFTLRPEAINGRWEGELQGRFIKGVVTSSGVARGRGALEGSTMYVQFQQVAQYPGKPPCENPKACFEMNGLILE